MREHDVAPLSALVEDEARAFQVNAEEIVLAPPAVRPLRVYRSRVDDDGRVHVELDD